MRRRTLRLFLLLALLAVFTTSAAIMRIALDLEVSNLRDSRTFVIPPRSTVSEMAQLLEEHGVIPDRWMFVLWVKLLNLESKLRYGEYSFCGSLSIKKVIDTLVSGRVTLHYLPVPEGFTLRQIAARIGARGLGSSAEIIAAGHDPALLAKLGIAADSVEGYCFPDTYLLPRDWPASRILERMTGRFQEMFDSRMRRRAAEIGLSVHEVVTLASIVEKEAWLDWERPMISGVFHNRLRKGIPLMADPAVIYGIKNFDGNLTRAELARPGPYNVYLNKGLPPGPICNPGLASLKAALDPAEVDFLYFVSKNNGTHFFSKSLTEHNQAVNLYQRGGH